MLRRTKLALWMMFFSTIIGIFWDKLPFIKNLGHKILNPLLTPILNWNLSLGFTFIIFAISLFIILVQKYATDQETLKALKKEQKKLQEDYKDLKNDPKKLLEFNKKSMEITKDIFLIGLDSWIYTLIPLVLLFRWFNDYFSVVQFKLFGLNWFLYQFVFSIIFSIILKKALKVE